MNACESKRHYLKYYKICIPNQHTNLGVILEWQRQFQMVSHKRLIFNVNEVFFVFDLQVNYMFHWQFHFRNEIPINCLFTNWKCTYILDFRPWRWSALNMGFVVKRPSRIKGNDFFKVGQGGHAWISRRVQEFPWSDVPVRIWHPWKFVRGCLTSAKNKRHCLSKVVHVSVRNYSMRM